VLALDAGRLCLDLRLNRTSEYLTASGSAAHHFVVRRSAFALGNEHGGAFEATGPQISKCSIRGGERIARDLH